jgi:integrase
VVWAFVVNLTRGGTGARRRLVRSGFQTKQEAERAQAELVAETLSGYVAPAKITVGAYLIERWLPRTRTSPKTRLDRETHMKAYVVPRIGGLALPDLTGGHLTEMYDDLAVNGRTRKPDPDLGWGLSPTTIRRIHTQLHKAFEDAIRWGLLHRNPCDRADPPSTNEVKARSRQVRQTYTWDQLRAFVTAAQNDRLYAMWYLFATTGMRRSEMAALLWRNIDLDERLLSVTRAAVEVKGKVYERELTKSSSSRRAIELDDVDARVLREHRRRQAEERLAFGGRWREPDRVFTNLVGGRLYPPDIPKAFHAILEKAGPGYPESGVYTTSATRWPRSFKSGEVTKVVTDRLGHSTTAYTQRIPRGHAGDATRRRPPIPKTTPAARNRGPFWGARNRGKMTPWTRTTQLMAQVRLSHERPELPGVERPQPGPDRQARKRMRAAGWRPQGRPVRRRDLRGSGLGPTTPQRRPCLAAILPSAGGPIPSPGSPP